MLEKLDQAIWELLAENCDRKNLIISMSPLITRLFEDTLYRSRAALYQMLTKDGFSAFYQGIPVSNIWPYNEIVIYDLVNVCYHPQLLIKIEFTRQDKTEFTLKS